MEFFTKRTLHILFLPLFVSACGGSGSDTPFTSSSSSAAYNFVSIDVTGTSADITGNKAPINPGVNGGDFSVEWTLLDPSEDYLVRVYVSADQSLSVGSDILIDSFSCTNAAATCATQATYQLDCNFNNANEMECSDGPVDLSTFLNVIPKDAYFVLQSCPASGSGCASTRNHAIQIQ